VEKESFPGQWSLPNENLTVSIGLADYPQDGMHPGSLLRFAEEQLELAQATGNRCVPNEAERRRETRRKVCTMVEVEYSDKSGFMPAMAVDISSGGMAIGGDLALKAGMPLTIRFKAPFWPKDRTVQGLVRQSSLLSYNKLPRFGLEFLQKENFLIPPFNEGLSTI